MWMFLSILAIAAALAYSAREFAHALPRIALNLPQRQPFILPSDLKLTVELPRTIKVEDQPKVPVAPREVLEFCALESETFAQQALLMKAHRFYAETGNWEAALSRLKQEAAPEPAVEVSSDGE